MPWTRILPTMAVLALTGTGLGLHLGRATIGEVDPFYFTEPQGTRSYAEMVPAASRTGLTNHASDLSDTEGGYGTGCVVCDLRQASYAAAYDGRRDAYVDSAWTPEEEPPVEYALYEPALDAGDLDEELRRVELYASYPVSSEAAETHEAAVAAVLEQPDPAQAPVSVEESVTVYAY